ncbi:uncharacterized protein GJ701_006240 [Geothlypis trichas]
MVSSVMMQPIMELIMFWRQPTKKLHKESLSPCLCEHRVVRTSGCRRLCTSILVCPTSWQSCMVTHRTWLSVVVTATIPPFLKLMDPGSRGQEMSFHWCPSPRRWSKSDEMLCSLPAKEDKWQVITEGVELLCKKSTGKWIWLKFNKESTRGSPAEFLITGK